MSFDLCSFCRHNPPSACDGKPCTMCPASGRLITTNADRIRAMSDEELADIFLKADFCKLCDYNKNGVCDYICSYPNIPLYEGCKQAAVKWMKQPAEED